jgi:DMSO/TMAO reductase YedYZ molybdopterin-dependent catalytic subunit
MKDASNKGISRKGFITKSTLATFGALLGAKIVFGENMPADIAPVGLRESDFPAGLKGKHPGLIVLNDKPWNMETPPHLLDDSVTPADKFFVRNNGQMPVSPQAATWTLTISGESALKKTIFSIADLQSKFKTYTYQLLIECGGNGRKEFDPPAQGLQWGLGGLACARWTGVRLKDVLASVGVKPDAVYIGYRGKDTHLSGESGKDVISRGIPMKKALEDETLIAWAMNGEEIPLANGFPLRLVVGGWPGSVSGKWLSEIMVRNKVHDGAKMSGHSYRMPRYPVAPGTTVPDELLDIIESMPVKSMITFPATGATFARSRMLEVRGHAWAGDLLVTKMEVSIDFGATWKPCELLPPPNRLCWQRWKAKISFPEQGYYEVWARATDSKGVSQPMVVPGWNPGGYLNNATHRIAVMVTA